MSGFSLKTIKLSISAEDMTAIKPLFSVLFREHNIIHSYQWLEEQLTMLCYVQSTSSASATSARLSEEIQMPVAQASRRATELILQTLLDNDVITSYKLDKPSLLSWVAVTFMPRSDDMMLENTARMEAEQVFASA